MKALIKKLKFPALLISLITMSACSNSTALNGKGGYYYGGYSYGEPGVEDAPRSGESYGTPSYKPGEEDDIEMEGDPKSTNEPTINPKQLTCSALDDNKYYDEWLDLNGLKDQNTNQVFVPYQNNYGKTFVTSHRVKLTVKNGNDISIKLKDETNKFYVDNSETAYFFPKVAKEEYEVEISYLNKEGERASYSATVHDNDVIDLENEFTLSNRIEIMFVVDATGSMGDEMEYIKTEIIDVLTRVKNSNPEATIQLAMMVYRDTGDEYVTKYSDFTTDIESQQRWFARQGAAGGGDTPEAVEVALNEAVSKQWSNNCTKLLIHVADAPSHKNDINKWANEVYNAADKGIKIITVSGSGISKETEYLFRCQSMITAGQYVFLTDDSNIGYSHTVATTSEELTVEYLNDCLVRLINGYATGDMKEPISWKQA